MFQQIFSLLVLGLNGKSIFPNNIDLTFEGKYLNEIYLPGAWATQVRIETMTLNNKTYTGGVEYNIKIDNVLPVAGTVIIKNNDGTIYTPGTWTNQDVKVTTINGSDLQSGHKSTTSNPTAIYLYSGSKISNVITTTTDNVGNVATRTYQVKIDKELPIAGYATFKTADGKVYTPGNWTNQDVTATVVNGSDTGSGHKTTVSSISKVTASGTTTVTITTTDNAGNIAKRTYTVKIDKIAPNPGTATFKNSNGTTYYAYSDGYSDWTAQDVTVTAVNGSDSLSGHKSTVSSISKVTAMGTTIVTITTTDNAGNIAKRTYKVKKCLSNGIYKYTVLSNEVKLVEYIGPDNVKNIIIPSTIGSYKVTTIGEYTFSWKWELTGTLVIPSNIKTIEQYAFLGCDGFTGTLTIPANVKKIGECAFGGCVGIKNINMIAKLDSLSYNIFDYSIGLSGKSIFPDNVSLEFQNEDGSLYKPGTYTSQNVFISAIWFNYKPYSKQVEYNIMVDKATIAGTATFKTSDGKVYEPGTWTNKDVTITKINGSDSVSGHKSTVCNYTKVTANGITEVLVTTTNNKGNVAKRKYYIYIDKQIPIAGTATFKNADGSVYKPGEVTNQDVIVSYNYYDVARDQLSWIDTEINYSRVTANGLTKVILKTKDEAGNIATRTYDVRIDRKVMVAGTAIFKTADGKVYTPGTWTNQNVSVTVINGSDIVNGHKSTVSNVTSVTKDGITKVIITTTNNKGTVATRTYEVKIDKIAPTAGWAIFKTADGKVYTPGIWTNQDVTVTVFSGSDGISGHKSTVSNISKVTAGGTTKVVITTTDNRGNIGARTYDIKIDKIAPVAGTATFKNANGSVYTPGEWTNQDVTVTLVNGSDLASGHKSTVSSISKVTASGITKVVITTTDIKGYVSTRTYEVKIDRKVLVAGTAIFKTADGKVYIPGTWTNQNVLVTVINGSDIVNGHKSTVSNISSVTKDGITKVTITTTNNKGTIATRTYEVKIDRVAPVAGYATFKHANGTIYIPGSWTDEDVIVTVYNGSDSVSGHKSTICNYSKVTAEGKTIVTITTTDGRGNISKRTYEINISRGGGVGA